MTEIKNENQLCSTTLMHIAKIGYVVLSVLLCLLGLIFITVPNLPFRKIEILIGAVFLAFGCIKIIGYFSRDLFRLAFQYDLEFGLLAAVLGILCLLHPNSRGLVCTGLGLTVFLDALFKIRITLEARSFGIRSWWVVMAAAVAAALLGVLLLLRPLQLSAVLGLTFIAEGLMSMSAVLIMVKIIRNQIRD